MPELDNNYDSQFNKPLIESKSTSEVPQNDLENKVAQFNRLSGLETMPTKVNVDMDEIEQLPGLVDPHTRDIASELHEKQSWYSSLGSAVNQAVVGELAGGTIEGTGYLLDIEQYAALAQGTEREFGNWFSDLGKSLKTWTREATPVYGDPDKQGEWAPEDWTWWMSNLPSVASTLSLAIPSGAVVKGGSMLARAMNLSNKVGQKAKWA